MSGFVKNNDVLPAGWVWITLDKACLIIQGQSPESITYNDEGKGVPFFQGKAEFGELNPSPVKWCTSPKKKALKGDILISVRAPVGPTNIAPFECCIGRGLAALRSRDGIDSKYILYNLRSQINEIANMGTGSTFTAINGAQLKGIEIPLAPLDQQKLIVSEIEKQFSRLDEAVAALKRVRASLKRYKASVLKAAVEGKLTEEWRKQNPDVEPADILLERIKKERSLRGVERRSKLKGKEEIASPLARKDNLPELPKGWVWATLPQLGELNRGKSKHRPRNAPYLYGGKYPFIQTGDIKAANGIIRHYSQTYSEDGLKQSRLWPTGTLCITIAANIADTAILKFDACFPDSIVGFLAEPQHCDIRFIEYFLRTAKKNIERYAPATAQKNINLEILSDVAFPLPSVYEQKLIVEEIESRLSVAEEIEETIDINLKRAERLRQAILKKAFSGKI